MASSYVGLAYLRVVVVGKPGGRRVRCHLPGGDWLLICAADVWLHSRIAAVVGP